MHRDLCRAVMRDGNYYPNVTYLTFAYLHPPATRDSNTGAPATVVRGSILYRCQALYEFVISPPPDLYSVRQQWTHTHDTIDSIFAQHDCQQNPKTSQSSLVWSPLSA